MLEPKLVASTCQIFDQFSRTDSELRQLDSPKDDGLLPENTPRQSRSNFFSQAQWSADGTSLVANASDQQIRTFVVPSDLLEERIEPCSLENFSKIPSPESVYATTLYPGFQLQDPSTTLILSSIRDHPVRLNSALDTSLLAAYPLVNQNTEAYICPHSLAFSPDGSKFTAGSDSLISVFDVSRPGSEPFIQLRTVNNKRRKGYGGSVGMKGIVSALAVEQCSSILAAGTFSGQVGLYSSEGIGETIGVVSLHGSPGHDSIGGSGVTQLKWSPCGKYLYVIERVSNGILVYDVRDTGQLLGWLEGRKASTNQRLGVDLYAAESDNGQEIWAGGVDGMVSVWSNPHMREGAQAPTWQWHGHDDAVTSALVHFSGSVVATCSGQRRYGRTTAGFTSLYDSDDEHDTSSNSTTDNSLKVWSIAAWSFGHDEDSREYNGLA